MTSVPTIGFDYRPSWWPGVLLTMIAVLALAAIASSGMPWWLSLATGGLVLAYLVHACRRSRVSPVRTVRWEADGGWWLRLDADEDIPARLVHARVVAGLVILGLAWAGRQRTVLLLFPDNLHGDIRRRLRMRLSVPADSN